MVRGLLFAALGLAFVSPSAAQVSLPSGGMAGQSPNAVAITGGTIDGTPIGSTTPAGGNFTNLSAAGPMTSVGQVLAFRQVTSGAITALSATDHFVCINKSTGSATTVTQAALTVGQTFTVKDCKGDANANNITYTPGAGITVDGQSSYVLNQPFQAVNLIVTSATTVLAY